MKDTIIYIRTSTEDQEPENQIKDCEKLSNNEYELLQDKQSAFTDKELLEDLEENPKWKMTYGRYRFQIIGDFKKMLKEKKD